MKSDQEFRQYWGFILFIALMGALPPLSTDMYLAAIPRIAEEWAVPASQVNLSLVLWFIAFSVCLLIYGSLSDRVGRKPVLVWGVAVFTVSSVLCAFAQNVEQLILFRILQGASAAAPSAMCLATCRDRFEGRLRQRILAWMGIIIGIAPMVAPSIGAVILQYANWHWIFGIQAILGGLLFILVLSMFTESAAELEGGGIGAMLARYGRLLRNRNFVMANCSMSLIAAPSFGFVAFSATAYISIYQLSEFSFGILFGVNALMTMTGAFICTRLLRYFPDKQLITVCLVGCTSAGLILLVIGGQHYLLFTLGTALYAIFSGMSRPLSNHLILEQVLHDIGAASSTIIFTQFLIGALCMAYVTAGWPLPILAFSLSMLVLPGITLAVWPNLRKRVVG